MFKDNRSIKDRLLEKGYILTSKKFGGWNNGKRLIIDKKGKKIGYLRPLEALKLIWKEITWKKKILQKQ